MRSDSRQMKHFWDLSLDILCIVGFDRRIQDVSPAFQKVLGYARDEVVGKPFTDFVHPDDMASLAEVKMQPDGYIAQRFATRCRCKDGSYKWLSWNAVAVKEERVVCATARDITEARQAREALRESEAKANALIKYAPTGIYEIDYRGPRLLSVNDAMCTLSGYTREELLALNPMEILVPESQKLFAERIKRQLAGQQIDDSVDFKVRKKDGSIIYVTLNITFSQNRPHTALVVGYDVTERRRTEKDLKSRIERLQILSEATSLLLSSDTPEKMIQTIASKVMDQLGCDCFFNFILDEKAGKLRLNAYAGIPEETARGMEWLDLGVAICGCAAQDGCRIVSENVQENGDMRAALVRSFGVQAYACHPLQVGLCTVGTLSFGTRRRTSFTPDELEMMKTIAGQISVAIGRKRVEEALQHYTHQLEEANKELESFNYSVSHDLRQPLRALESFSGLLIEDYRDKVDETGQHYLDRIMRASQLISQLTDDMLRLSGVLRADMYRDSVNLSHSARAIAEELQSYQPERQVEIEIAPDLVVNGDKNLLAIALRNLLENAWKFTGRCPQPRIEVGMEEKEGAKVYFVRDNGIGFDMQYESKLFQPFQRLTTDKSYPGTGIGLAIVQRVIRRHGGKVWAEAAPGQGATFYFTLG